MYKKIVEEKNLKKENEKKEASGAGRETTGPNWFRGYDPPDHVAVDQHKVYLSCSS
jgi:hypothetical protein